MCRNVQGALALFPETAGPRHEYQFVLRNNFKTGVLLLGKTIVHIFLSLLMYTFVYLVIPLFIHSLFSFYFINFFFVFFIPSGRRRSPRDRLRRAWIRLVMNIQSRFHTLDCLLLFEAGALSLHTGIIFCRCFPFSLLRFLHTAWA